MWSNECCAPLDDGHHVHHDYAHYSMDHHQCFEQQGQVPLYNSAGGGAAESHVHSHVHHHDHDSGHCQPVECPEYCQLGWSLVPDVSSRCDVQTHCAHYTCDTSRTSTPESEASQKSKIFAEIYNECEHYRTKGQCDKCTVRDEQGVDKSIPIQDLVEIVLQTAENFKSGDQTAAGDVISLSKKREQNKQAAAKYRDKQKARWQQLQDERVVYEKKNDSLRDQVTSLEKEVEQMRKKVLAQR